MGKNTPLHTETYLWQKITLVLFGVVLALVLLEVGLRLGGDIVLYLQEHRNTLSIKQKGEYKILCIGESTTAAGGSYSYPSQLEQILNERNMGIKFSVINKGIWATTTDAIAAQLDPNLDTYTPHMVIVMVGINDERLRLPKYNPKILHVKFIRFTSSLRTIKLIHHIIDNFNNLVYLRKNKWHSVNQWRVAESDTNNAQIDEAFYISLGYQYKWNDQWKEAEEVFLKALKLNPRNDALYLTLGWMYDYLDRKKEAETMFKKYIELNPGRNNGYSGLGTMYTWQGLYDKAEAMFKKAVEVAPGEATYLDLSWFYKKMGRLEEAIRILESFKAVYKSDIFYGSLGELYQEQGKHLLAGQCFQKANEIRNSGYYQKTYTNFRIIADKVLGRGIRLVWAQYPVRAITPLKKILEDYREIIFVDNEKIFKDAISRTGYDDYFWDKYGGDFGHCTNKGNKLLAENIAHVIVKDIFGK